MSRSKSEKFLSQPYRLSKALLACKYGIESGCQTVIETGTFLGASSYLFSGVFENVHTIEAEPSLYRTATYWLSVLRNNIRTYNGNSGEMLSILLSNIDEPCLIFLDAHWSTGITSQEFGVSPLLNELAAIFNSPNNHTIVVDDIRCIETEGYPGFAEVFGLIPAGKEVQINYDQMIIK